MLEYILRSAAWTARRGVPASVSRPSATRNDPDRSKRQPSLPAADQSRRLSARRHADHAGTHVASRTLLARTVDGLDRRVEAGDRRQLDDDLARRVTPCGTARARAIIPDPERLPATASVQFHFQFRAQARPNHSRAPITKAWPSSATLKSQDFPSFGLTRRACGFRAAARGGAIARAGYEPPSQASRFDAADRRAVWRWH